MKNYRQTRVALIMLFAALAMSLGLAAQNTTTATKKAQHHHYKLIDVGTFGGPQSYFNDNGFLFELSLVNNRGQLVGWADTSQPDPFSQSCFDPDCFTAHAFLWQDGERTDLGLLPDGASSAANWISSNGLVAGFAENGQIDPLLGGPEGHAVVWQNGSITDLGTLEGGYTSIANAVNKDGQVVGVFANDVPDQNSMFGNGYQTRAFLWQHGVMQDLGTLGGTDAQAVSINDRGQVVGWSYTSSSPGTCSFIGPLVTGSFIWEEGKGMTDLGSFGGTCTDATDLNNKAQVVGASNLAGDVTFHGFLWSNGTLHDLGGSLGGSWSNALALNEHGEVVGAAALAGDVVYHAVLWKQVGQLSDLGTIIGGDTNFALSVNSKTQIVGAEIYPNGAPAAFLWENGSIVDLNTLVSHSSQLGLAFALDINDRGEIAINAADASGNGHAVLLIPCDDAHRNVEGCDYSMVDPSTAVAITPTLAPKASPFVQTNPASSGAANRMLRRFGRRLGPWNRGIGIPTPALRPTGALPAGVTPQRGTEGAPEESPSRSQGSDGESGAQQPESAVAGSLTVRGYCEVNGQGLNGACVGHPEPTPLRREGRYAAVSDGSYGETTGV